MRRILLAVVLFVTPCVAVAQSQASAYENGPSLQAGAELSSFNPDFYCSSSSPFNCGGGPLIKGVGVFADYNVRPRWGAEAEARWLRWDGSYHQSESTYLIGPRYRAYRWRALDLWVKLLVGNGAITTSNYPGPLSVKGNFFVYALGVPVDYRLNRRFSVRGEYEWQRWPTFAAGLGMYNHGLTPNGFNVGIAYTIIGH